MTPVPRYQLPTVADPVDAFDIANKQYVDGLPKPLTGIKTADETIINDATLNEDAEVRVSLKALKAYSFVLMGLLTTLAAPDFKWDLICPGATQGNYQTQVTTGASATDVNALGTTIALIKNGTGSWFSYGFILMGAADDELILRWSQNSSSGSDTTLKAGTSLVAHESA